MTCFLSGFCFLVLLFALSGALSVSSFSDVVSNDDYLMENAINNYLATGDLTALENSVQVYAAIQEQMDEIITRAGDILPTLFNVFLGMVERRLERKNETSALDCLDHIIDVLVRSRMKGNSSLNWAKKWTDSRGRRQSGLWLGALHLIGAPEECTGAHPPLYDDFLNKRLYFDSKFCRLFIRFTINVTLDTSVPLPIGFCLPSDCSLDSINAIYQAAIDTLKLFRPEYETLSSDDVFRLRYLAAAFENRIEEEETAINTVGNGNNKGIIDILERIGNFLEQRLSLGQKFVCIVQGSRPLDLIATLGFASVGVVVLPNVVSTIFEFFYLLKEIKKSKQPEQFMHEYLSMNYSQRSAKFQLATSFSAIRNGMYLIDTRPAFKPLAHVAGIRVITMAWIILARGHIYGSWLFNLDNPFSFLRLQRTFINQVIKQATFGGDTFFLLTGFFCAFCSIKKLQNKTTNKWCYWGVFYIRRYIRITPMILLALWIYYSVSPWLYVGITIPQNHDKRCTKNWWTTILYINNFYEPRYKCLDWSWWFSLDVQFYITAPLFIIPFFKFPVVSILMALAAVAVHIGTSVAIGMNLGISSLSFVQAFELLTSFQRTHGAYVNLHVLPWTRIGPFGVGLLLGFIVSLTKFQSRINKVLAFLGWIFSIGVGLVLIYGLHPYQEDSRSMPRWLDISYLALSRIAWSASVAWVIFACSHGAGGLVKSFLSANIFQILGKITFVAAVIHPIAQNYFILSRERLFHYMVVDVIWVYCGHLVLTGFASAFFHIGFERPFVNLLDTALIGKITKSSRYKTGNKD